MNKKTLFEKSSAPRRCVRGHLLGGYVGNRKADAMEKEQFRLDAPSPSRTKWT